VACSPINNGAPPDFNTYLLFFVSPGFSHASKTEGVFPSAYVEVYSAPVETPVRANSSPVLSPRTSRPPPPAKAPPGLPPSYNTTERVPGEPPTEARGTGAGAFSLRAGVKLALAGSSFGSVDLAETAPAAPAGNPVLLPKPSFSLKPGVQLSIPAKKDPLDFSAVKLRPTGRSSVLP
jgi:hypothetical protein